MKAVSMGMVYIYHLSISNIIVIGGGGGVVVAIIIIIIVGVVVSIHVYWI